ncbi:MAG: PAS domain S-box protein, partial [Bacteroidota bacterium]
MKKIKVAEAEALKLIHELEVHKIELEMQNKELELAKKQVGQSLELNKAILQITSDWIWETDEQGKYCYCTENTEQIIGYTVDEMIGKSPFDFMSHEESERIKPIFQNIVEKKGSIVDLENWILHKDGHLMCVLTNGVPIFNETGIISGYRGADKDITDHKQAEEALRASEESFRILSDKSPIAIEHYNEEGVLLTVNPACLSLFGVTDIKEIQNFNLFADPNISDEYKKKLKRNETVRYQDLFDFEKVKEFKLYNTSKSGSIWIDAIITPLINNHGKVNGYLLHISDVTQRKQAEEALNKSESLYRSVIQASPDGIATTDLQGCIQLASPRVFKMFGYETNEQLIDRNINEFIFPEDRERAQSEIMGMHQGILMGPAEYRGIRANGSIIDVEVNGEFIRNPEGNSTGMIFIIRDITDRKLIELELIKSKEKAEESDRLKSVFLSNMSHEIRTPMNAILGFTGLFKKPDLTAEEQQDYIRIIEESGERLLNTLNDIIDFSKIESEMTKIVIKETNINEGIEYVFSIFRA